jgi:hypothetical protein
MRRWQSKVQTSSVSFFGGAGICSQGLVFARQALYHLTHTFSPLTCSFNIVSCADLKYSLVTIINSNVTWRCGSSGRGRKGGGWKGG